MIPHNEEKFGKEDSEGDYIIGVYSYANQTFSIFARSVEVGQIAEHNEDNDISDSKDIPLTKLFQGNSHDYFLNGFSEGLFLL